MPPATIADAAGRAAYRIVQEGLTNARKHAPGTEVRIEFGAVDGLTVVISNRLVAAAEAALPGTGLGLIGLRERVELLGGRLSYGASDAAFRLAAWLPLAHLTRLMAKLDVANRTQVAVLLHAAE